MKIFMDIYPAAVLLPFCLLYSACNVQNDSQATKGLQGDTSSGSLRLASDSVIRIMPLGDSITWGFEGLAGTVVNYGGYRAPLYTALNKSYPGQIDFVGSSRNDTFPGDPAGIDANQEGHSGWTSSDLSNNIGSWLSAANPNYILLMIGSNDLYHCTAWSQSEASLANIINSASAHPSVKRILAANVTPLVPDQGGCRNNATINDFNRNLKSFVQKTAAQGKPVSFVDMNALSGLTRDDMSDGLHPNKQGYAKIAEVWNRALAAHLATRGDGGNADHKADIYWRNLSTGQNLIWEMNGATRSSDRWLPSEYDQAWKMEGTADFNGDGVSDVVWRNYANGSNRIWLMDRASTTVLSAVALPPVGDSNWHIAGTADMNGDGFPDIAWHNRSSNEAVSWIMGPGGAFLRMQHLAGALAPDWRLSGLADFNHDGFPDELWRHAEGHNLIWFLDENGNRIGEQGLPFAGSEFHLAGIGDFNGDGWIDIAWHNASDLSNSIWQMGMTDGKVSFTNLQAPTSQPGWEMQGPR